MPSGVFKPYAGVSTAVLVFTKTCMGGTDKVWFYDMKSDGFSLDDKRSPVEQNDIPDIIRRFRSIGQTPPVTKGDIPLREGDNADDILNEEKERAPSRAFVPKKEIADNGYDLSIKYKKVEYVPVEYPSTTEIMADLHELEMEITAGLGTGGDAVMARLGDIGTIITGNTPKTSDNQNYASSDISFVKPSDIDDNELTDLHSSNTIFQNMLGIKHVFCHLRVF